MTCKHCTEAHDDMLRYAANLERYPFGSSTMAEAAKLAAGVLRNIADDFDGTKRLQKSLPPALDGG